MNYLNIHTDTLRSDEYLGAEPVVRATWLNLLGWCVTQENGGTIKEADQWGERKWLQVCGITLQEATLETKLYSIDESGNMLVKFYPKEAEKLVKSRRKVAKENGAKGGRPQKKKAKKSTKNTTVTNSSTDENDNKPNFKSVKEGKGKEATPNPQGGWEDIYPDGCFRKPKTQQKQIKVLKNNKRMNYIGKWFGRSEATLWNVKEAKVLENLNPTREEVLLMESYYTPRTEDKPLRKSIEILLNNWSGELDRANTHISETSAKTNTKPFNSL